MERKTDPLYSRYWLIAVVVVIAIAYSLLLSTAFNLPKEDDYDAILEFMNRFVTSQGAWAKASWFLASQHNEYKLFFVHALVVSDHALTGTLNFAVLQCLGDLGLLGIFAVLAWHLPGKQRLWNKGLLLLPLAFLSFSLRPFEALNWATGGLQTVPVVVFSLLAIYCITRPDRSWVGACLSLMLAIASSGNGLIVLVSGGFAIMERRRWRMLLPWTLTSIGCVACYGYHYHLLAPSLPASMVHHKVLSTVLFPIAFLGNALARPGAAVLYGAMLLATFAWLLRRGLRQQSPFVLHSAVFVVLTAVAVTVTRHSVGLGGALASRYGLYGLLLTALIYIGALCCLENADVPTGGRLLALSRRSAFVAGACLWCFVLWQHHLLNKARVMRNEKAGTLQSFSAWEHGTKRDPTYIPPDIHSEALDDLALRSAGIAERAEQLHVVTFH